MGLHESTIEGTTQYLDDHWKQLQTSLYKLI